MGLAGLGSSLCSVKGFFRNRNCDVRERRRWRLSEAWVLSGCVTQVLVRSRVSRGEWDCGPGPGMVTSYLLEGDWDGEGGSMQMSKRLVRKQ